MLAIFRRLTDFLRAPHRLEEARAMHLAAINRYESQLFVQARDAKNKEDTWRKGSWNAAINDAAAACDALARRQKPGPTFDTCRQLALEIRSKLRL